MSLQTSRAITRSHMKMPARLTALGVLASLAMTMGVAMSPAHAQTTPVGAPQPTVAFRAAEGDEDLDDAVDEESVEDAAATDAEEPSDEGVESPSGSTDTGNADFPEEGEYTCLTPGLHDLNVAMGTNFPRATLKDHTQDPAEARENYTVVIPVPQYSSRGVTSEDVAAGLGAVANEGATLWVLPQQQDPKLSWFALDTRDWDYARSTNDGMSISLNYVDGPGVMKLWTYTPENGVNVLLDSTQTNKTVVTREASYAHVNTSFDRPGFYEVDYGFRGDIFQPERAKPRSAAFTMYYAVGDDVIRQVCGPEFIPTPDAPQTPDETNAGAQGAGEFVGKLPSTGEIAGAVVGSDNSSASDNSATSNNAGSLIDSPEYKEALMKALFGDKTEVSGTQNENGDAPQSSAPNTPTPADGAQSVAPRTNTDTTTALTDVPQSAPQSTTQETRNEKPVTTAPTQHKHDKQKTPTSEQKNTATGAHNTDTTTLPETCEAVTITRESTPEEADKVRQARAEQGTARTTLSFSVGDNASGNANDGHFDLGPVIDNGTVYARVKDDRQQPAQWVDPTSLVFGVGAQGALKAPAQLDFVATPGKTVWMIQQTQQANVPWLGMNSQHESLQGQTRGEVLFTLEEVDGPGKVAVFESGAFGGGIGRIVFNGAGSSSTLSANTHAHYNWVFTEPGAYNLTFSMKVESTNGTLKGSGSIAGITLTGETGPNGRPMLEETVGRTPSGKECDLAQANGGAGGGKLARTGAIDVMPLGLAAVVFGALMTAAHRTASRKRRS